MAPKRGLLLKFGGTLAVVGFLILFGAVLYAGSDVFWLLFASGFGMVGIGVMFLGISTFMDT